MAIPYLLFVQGMVYPERRTKWKNRYNQKGIDGLSDLSKRPHNIKYRKITSEIQETIVDLRLTKRFGCNRIKFRLRRTIGLSKYTNYIQDTKET